MAAVLGRTEIAVQKIGGTCTVLNNDIANLMYYFNSVCSCIEPDNSDTIRRLRNYDNYASLSRDEEAQLLALCLALSPDKLIGSVLFPSEDYGGSSNKFLELSAVSTNLVVAESFVVGQWVHLPRRYETCLIRPSHTRSQPFINFELQ